MKIKEKPTALKLIAAVLSFLIISSVLPYFAVTASAAITPSTPQKNSNGVYQIGSAAELYGFAQLVNSGNTTASAVLTADIVVNTGVLKADGTLNSGTFTDWTPIGSSSKKYTGKFDGQNHTISGLYFNNKNADYVGLFGYFGSGGDIKNVGVIDSYFNGYYYVSGVCGYNSGGTITSCYNTGTVSGNYDYVGGVCGVDHDGKITGCYNTGTVSGRRTSTGGVCGYNWYGEITGCYSNGTVSGKVVGGVCGLNYSHGKMTGCYNTGTVSGSYHVGGVCGENSSNGTITGCYTNNGGVCGVNNGTATDCAEHKDAEFADGTVCGLLNTALKNENSDIRYYQGVESPEFIHAPQLVGGVYQISSAAELYWFAQLVNSSTTNASAVLTADIIVNKGVLKADGNLADDTSTFTDWTPIGTDYDHTYTGKFDGQGHTISGLYFNAPSTDYVGLFGYLGFGGGIKNVGVIDSYFKGHEYIGGVCGYNDDMGTIIGCYNTSTVSGSSEVGGVCGSNTGTGTITGCYNIGAVSGMNGVGGVCGFNIGTIIGSYNTGTVSGSSEVGGVCGYNANKGKITGCYTNNKDICGLNNGTVKDCEIKSDAEFADGTVCTLLNTALNNYDVRFYQGANYPEPVANVPDLVEGVYQISNKLELYAFAKIVNRFEPSASAVLTADIVVNTGVLKDDGTLNSGTFTSWTPIGNDSNTYTGTFDGQNHTISGLYFNDSSTNYVGLFGYLGLGGEIKNVGVIDSYFSGRESVGGVCGWNEGTITGCYNTGAVSSSGYYVGGVCAVNKGGTIIGCYNTGTVSGVNGVGGVCAVNNSTITGCYNTGEVSGSSEVGGVCGFNSGTITGCYINKGGVCGSNFSGTVTGCDVKTDAEFANGTVCKLLNTALKNASSKVLFCQTIGTDVLPLLDYQIEEHTPIYTVENNTFKFFCLCGKKSKTMELTLKTDKTVVVNGAENTLTATLSNLENEAVTYKWYQNGVEIQGETSATYKMPTDLALGTYTYKVEVTMGNIGTITQSVDVLVDITPQYYVNIPATVNIGDDFTVEASNVLLKNNAQLKVSLESDFILSTAKGSTLNYEILNNSVKLTTGETLLTVQGSQDPKAPGSGTSETYNVALAQGEKAKYSGNYTDTLTFTIKVEQ